MSDVLDFGQDLWDGIRGKTGAEAAKDAAAVQSDSYQAGIDEQRRQFDFIQELMAPFVNNGVDQSGNVTQGASASGFDDRLGEIFNSDVFSQVKDQRLKDANNALSQSGLSRSGGAIQELTDIPLETALALEDQLYGRQSNIYNGGQNAAAGLGGFSQNTSNAVTNLLGNQGTSYAQGIIGAGQSEAAGMQNLFNLGSNALMAFSDPRLKKNMEPVGKIHDLTLYEWDWIDGMPEGFPLMSTGYNADEVAEKYPEYVAQHGGYKVINYTALNDHLEDKIQMQRAA